MFRRYTLTFETSSINTGKQTNAEETVAQRLEQKTRPAVPAAATDLASRSGVRSTAVALFYTTISLRNSLKINTVICPSNGPAGCCRCWTASGRFRLLRRLPATRRPTGERRGAGLSLVLGQTGHEAGPRQTVTTASAAADRGDPNWRFGLRPDQPRLVFSVIFITRQSVFQSVRVRVCAVRRGAPHACRAWVALETTRRRRQRGSVATAADDDERRRWSLVCRTDEEDEAKVGVGCCCC